MSWPGAPRIDSRYRVGRQLRQAFMAMYPTNCHHPDAVGQRRNSESAMLGSAAALRNSGNLTTMDRPRRTAVAGVKAAIPHRWGTARWG